MKEESVVHQITELTNYLRQAFPKALEEDETAVENALRHLKAYEGIWKSDGLWFAFTQKRDAVEKSILRCVDGGVDEDAVRGASHGVCEIKLGEGKTEPTILLNHEDISGDCAGVMILPGGRALMKRHLRNAEGRVFAIRPDGPDGSMEIAAVWVEVGKISGTGTWLSKDWSWQESDV